MDTLKLLCVKAVSVLAAGCCSYWLTIFYLHAGQ
jgi:hypothetical protein